MPAPCLRGRGARHGRRRRGRHAGELAPALLNFLLEPDSIAIYRLVVAEGGRTPELGRAFYEAGPVRLQARLAAYLRRMDEHGMLSVPEPEIAAVELVSLIRADLHLKALFAFDRLPGPAEIRRRAEAAVQTFLRAYGTEAGKKAES